jgi:hypothetical protein
LSRKLKRIRQRGFQPLPEFFHLCQDKEISTAAAQYAEQVDIFPEGNVATQQTDKALRKSGKFNKSTFL